MKRQIQQAIEYADSRALATNGPCGINVVPVSVIEVFGQYIYLYDFFMKKTVDNILVDPQVALVCWKEFSGIQIKATAVYETGGPAFEGALVKMKDLFPERNLKGVIRLSPSEAFDVAPGSGKRICGKAGCLLKSCDKSNCQ